MLQEESESFLKAGEIGNAEGLQMNINLYGLDPGTKDLYSCAATPLPRS